MNYVASICLVSVFAGCRGDSPPYRGSSVATSSTASGRIAPNRSAAADSLRDDLVEHGLLVPDGGREPVIARLGRPDSVRWHTESSAYDPAMTDSTAYLFYSGLRLDYAVRKGNQPDLLQIADVSDNRYLKYPALGVGATVAAIVSALGEPSERTDDSYSYVCGRCVGPGEPVIFHLQGGRVKGVEYQFYVD